MKQLLRPKASEGFLWMQTVLSSKAHVNMWQHPLLKSTLFFLNLQGQTCDLLQIFTFCMKKCTASKASTIQHISTACRLSGTHPASRWRYNWANQAQQQLAAVEGVLRAFIPNPESWRWSEKVGKCKNGPCDTSSVEGVSCTCTIRDTCLK